jgi:hypothetical protein
MVTRNQPFAHANVALVPPKIIFTPSPMQGRLLILLVIFSVIVPQCWALLPGIRPRTYFEGDPIKLLVNKMTSPRTQLPYSYYSLPFCRPTPIVDTRENLGEMLMGDRLENSLYNVDIIALFFSSSVNCLCFSPS